MRMDRVRARAATLALAVGIVGLAGGLAGCMSMRRLAAEPPQPVSLSGNWKLDPARSTDTRKALANLARAAQRGRRVGRSGLEGMEPGGPGGTDPALGALLASAPEQFAPDIEFQTSLLAGGDWLRIEQRPDEVVIANADTSHSYVPGEHSVVSVPSGVADQRSGWKGREFWIEIKPQVGPGAVERLRLSPDGRQLIEIIEIGSEGRIPKLRVTRVYDSTGAIPSVVPDGD